MQPASRASAGIQEELGRSSPAKPQLKTKTHQTALFVNFLDETFFFGKSLGMFILPLAVPASCLPPHFALAALAFGFSAFLP